MKEKEKRKILLTILVLVLFHLSPQESYAQSPASSPLSSWKTTLDIRNSSDTTLTISLPRLGITDTIEPHNSVRHIGLRDIYYEESFTLSAPNVKRDLATHERETPEKWTEGRVLFTFYFDFTKRHWMFDVQYFKIPTFAQ